MTLPRKRERGAAAVEFALILPILLLLIGGTIDFGRVYYQQIQLSNAARDGVRQVALNTSGGWTQAQIQGRIAQAAAPLVVTSAAPAGWFCSTSGTTVTVTVSPATAFQWSVLGFVPGLPLPTLQGKAAMTCP